MLSFFNKPREKSEHASSDFQLILTKLLLTNPNRTNFIAGRQAGIIHG